MHNPVYISSFLESPQVLGIHIGASAIGSTTSPQRRMEGFQMIGMHLFGSHRLCGVGMLRIRSLIFGPFGTALMPLRPFVLEPHFDAFGQHLFGPPPLARPQGFAAQLKQETPIPPLPIGQERHIARLLDDLAQETQRVFKQLAVFASTLHVPQKAGRPIHQHNRPAL
jgi:hypothetical protein